MINEPLLRLGYIAYRGALSRFARLRREEDGASVLEWVLIAAATVLAATIVIGVIIPLIHHKADGINKCANSESECDPNGG